MKNVSVALAAALGFLSLHSSGRMAAAPAGIAGEYKITSASRPDKSGSYTGKVVIESAGASSQVHWTLGSGEEYSGPAILKNGVLGVGYGEGLAGLAVYEIKGRTLKAKWLLPATPQQVGEYELSGPASLSGTYKFTSGLAGGVTIKPNGKIFDMHWNLPTGGFDGIGVRVGDVLVAVSGSSGTSYGVAAYRVAGDHLEGVWAVPGQAGLGTEVLGSPSSSAAASTTVAGAEPSAGGGGDAAGFDASGANVRFAGETYHLEHSASAPGKSTSELREFLRPGEDFDHYAKMVSLRLQPLPGNDPSMFAQSLLKTVKKDNPQTETQEVRHTDHSSTVEFLLVKDSDAEYNLFHYFRVPQGVAAVQFVLRNKPPFDTKDKFKAERKDHLDAWLRDVRLLESQVPDALVKTVRAASVDVSAKPAETPAKKAEMSNEELQEKIAADLRIASGIAGNFLILIQDGKLNEAAALMSDEGLAKMGMSRKDFLTKLQQAQKTDGRMLSFAPDKDKLDFGAEPGGGVYYALEADSKFEKTAAREKLRFLRFPDGKVKMVNYQRTK